MAHRPKKKRKRTASKETSRSDVRDGSGRLFDNPSPRLTQARALWDQGQQTQALRQYDEAVRREPENVRAHVLAARAYGEAYQLERMEEILERLVRRAPQHPGVHHYLGETYALVKLAEKSIAAYEHAASLPGALPGTWMELAAMYERAHRLDEATELIDRTEKAGFDLPLVWLVKARLQRRQKDVAGAEATLRQLIAKRSDGDEWACQAWGDLALIKDSAEDYDGAIDAIEHCKQAQLSRAAKYERGARGVEERLGALVDSLTRDDLNRWRDQTKAPDAGVALLTGFPRSGTTLLEQILDAHPRLVSSEERDYLGKHVYLSILAEQRDDVPLLEALNALSQKRIQFEREQYFQVMERLLGESIGRRMHLDKNPAYNLTIPLILRIFPETRLVVALRDPRDVVVSCYLRYLPLNAVSVRFLTLERTVHRYAIDMRAWLRFREIVPGRWCEIRYEDTVADIEKQARRALATLGLKWEESVLRYRERLATKKQVTSPTYEAVTQPVYTRAIGRWKHYERHLAPVLEKLEPFIEAFGYAT